MGSEAVGSEDEPVRAQRRDLAVWLLLGAVGLAVTVVAVFAEARLGTASPPFLGRYQVRVSPALLLAGLVAGAVLALAVRGRFDLMPWPRLVATGYLASLAWIVSLALTGGLAGITGPLDDPDGAATDITDIGDDPYGWLRGFTESGRPHSPHTRGHPPGPVLLLWTMHRIGVTDDLALGLLLTAGGALTVPLVLTAVRNACGELNARRYLPVVVLAPYALWAVHPDSLVATLGAAMIVVGAWATRKRGWQATVGGLGSGVLLGLAAMFGYAAAWLGLSVICLYFARRRPLLNVLTGVGVLVPVLIAEALGFSWVDGMIAAYADYAERVEPYRSGWWWAVLSLVALLWVTGPVLVASLRKLRNTPAWPFMVGAGAAVVFSLSTGFARGGIEHAWLAFFPWLTVAAVAPRRQGGPQVKAPLLLTAAGAAVALLLAAVIETS